MKPQLERVINGLVVISRIGENKDGVVYISPKTEEDAKLVNYALEAALEYKDTPIFNYCSVNNNGYCDNEILWDMAYKIFAQDHKGLFEYLRKFFKNSSFVSDKSSYYLVQNKELPCVDEMALRAWMNTNEDSKNACLTTDGIHIGKNYFETTRNSIYDKSTGGNMTINNGNMTVGNNSPISDSFVGNNNNPKWYKNWKILLTVGTIVGIVIKIVFFVS